MDLTPFLSCLSSVCFGVALVTARIGLRFIDARSGAAVSIPSATALFALATPFMFDVGSFNLGAALWFAVVGLFFPALVTILTFRSNETLGPTITATVSGTAPLFALPAAAFLVGESVPQKAAIASLAIVVGVGLISWKGGSARGGAVPLEITSFAPGQRPQCPLMPLCVDRHSGFLLDRLGPTMPEGSTAVDEDDVETLPRRLHAVG